MKSSPYPKIYWLALAALVGFASGILLAGRINADSAASWIGAVTTAGALGFALYELADSRQRAARDEAAAQARKIDAWTSPAKRCYQGSAYSIAEFTISNASDLAIRNVVISVDGVTTFIPIVAGRKTITRRVRVSNGTDEVRVLPGVQVIFADARETWWCRDLNGELTVTERPKSSMFGKPAAWIPAPVDDRPYLHRGDESDRWPSKPGEPEWAMYVRYLVVAARSLHVTGSLDKSDDGYFGPKTEKIVRELQTAQGETADGICGRQTWTALERALDDAGVSLEL